MASIVTEFFNRPASESTGLWSGSDPADLEFQSWATVRRAAHRAAQALTAAGVTRGSSVAILAGEPRDVAIYVQATWMCGAAFTMLHQPTPRSDLQAWLTDTRAVVAMLDSRVVVVGEPFAEPTRGLDLGAPMFVVGEADTHAPADDATHSLLDHVAFDHVVADPDDIAILQLTSGTTGVAKAVAISHRNVAQNNSAMQQAINIEDDDVAVSWLPLYHDMGMVGLLLLPMFSETRTVLTTPLAFLRNPLSWAELITKHGGTCTAAPNFAYAVLAKRLRRAPDGAYDLSSLRVAINGAEAVDEATLDLLLKEGERFGLRPEALMPSYGMAETTLATSFTPVDQRPAFDVVDAAAAEEQGRIERVSASAATRTFARLGPPVPGIEVSIVDEAGAALAADQIGSVLVRGDAVTTGYLGPDGFEATQNADGWLDTGDLGYLTPTGEVVISGRKKDVIIVSGRNLSPVVIERAAGGVAGVRPGNVAAVPYRAANKKGGETIAVIAESESVEDAAEVDRIRKDVTRAVFDDVGVPVSIVTVVGKGVLPKTPSGKLRRSAAIQLIEA